MKSDCVLDLKCTLGEGPVWLDGKLWFIDIEGQRIHWFDPSSSSHDFLGVGQRIGCALPTTTEPWLLGLQDGPTLWNPVTPGTATLLKMPGMHDPTTTRFNDGKTDPAGRAFMGSMGLQSQKNIGKLYRVDHDLSVTKIVDDITISNGLDWDRKLGAMYYIDTPTRKIDVFDWCAETGEITNRRTAFAFPEGVGYPDGMCIDVVGNLWVAMWGGSAVLCVDPRTGKIIEKIEVAATQITSCCFGGESLDQLYITSARIGMNADLLAKFPQSGGIFLSKPGVKGYATTLFGAR